jgi:hypothetical protein
MACAIFRQRESQMEQKKSQKFREEIEIKQAAAQWRGKRTWLSRSAIFLADPANK